MKVARSLEHAGAGLLRVADRGLHPLPTSTRPYLEVVQTQPLAGSLTFIGGNFIHGGSVAHTLEHSLAGGRSVASAIGNGVLSWETGSEVLKTGLGFLPGPIGAVGDVAINTVNVISKCF